MNFYEQPAQAQFVNTYVPIPFEQLMSVANAYKQDYEKNLEALRQYNKEAGEFQSLSNVDMQTWKAATTERLSPLLNEMTSNSDALKDVSNRAKLSNLINTTDYSLLGKLKSNAAVLAEAAKTYDPRWQDDTMEKIANWNTLNDGIYTNRNIEYTTLQDLSNPYFNLLGKEKYLGRSRDGMYDEYGIQMGHLQNVADDATINEIYSTPEGKKHVELARKRGIIPEGMSDTDYLKEAIIQSQVGRIGVTRRETNPFALEDYREKTRAASRLGKGSKKNEQTWPVTKYDQLTIDSKTAMRDKMLNSPYFGGKYTAVLTDLSNELSQFTEANTQMLQTGQITPEQYANNKQQMESDFYKRVEAIEKQLDSNDMLSNGINSMFRDLSSVDLRGNKKIDGNSFIDDPLAQQNAYRASREVVQAIAPLDSDASYIDMWMNTATGGTGRTINIDGSPRTSFIAPSSSGTELVTEYVNKLGRGNLDYNYRVKKVDGSYGNISDDITNGKFSSVILSPDYKVVTQRNKNGVEENVQMFTMLIPKESVKQAGYDPKAFDKTWKGTFGETSVTRNVSGKNVSESTLKDAYGTSKSGGFLGSGFGSEIDRVPQELVGDFYKVTVMKPMPRESSITNTAESKYDKLIGGTSLGKTNVDARAIDIYGSEEDILNAQAQRSINSQYSSSSINLDSMMEGNE